MIRYYTYWYDPVLIITIGYSVAVVAGVTGSGTNY